MYCNDLEDNPPELNVRYDSDDESDDEDEDYYDSLDQCIDTTQVKTNSLYSIADLIHGRPPPPPRPVQVDLKPIAFVRFNTSLGKAKPITIRALLDSGGSESLIASNHAKKLRLKETPGGKTVWTTPAGPLHTKYKCKCQFTLPELHDNRMISWNLHVSESLGSYDMIIGRDILMGLGINLQFSDHTIHWDGHEMPMKDQDATPLDAFHINESEAVQDATQRLKSILDAKYEPADLQAVAALATHLTKDEQFQLQTLLEKYTPLFDGTLGHWKDVLYDVELKPDATPYHAKAYPIPKCHMDTLKLEVERLCSLGVLKKVNRSEWAAPTFIVPKKDGSVRFISDFRELNKRIKRKPYPIPKIQDLLLKLEGFQHATSLDLNMGYYHIELSPFSKTLCTIVLPIGKYEYQRLPMGLCNSPDIFQEKMCNLLDDLEYVRAYIDDLLIITKSDLTDHLSKLEVVLQRLQEAGLKINAAKSFFVRPALEYLGYWITREGIQPVPKKVEAIRQIAAPTNKKDLRRFIGLVNYYRDMWIRRSHLLAPLAALTSKGSKWIWGDTEQAAFEAMKKVLARATLLAYPDFSKEFVIHTDASKFQLGSVISQDNKPIAFYSRKLKPAQTRYTTTERELLSIVETLKEFRNILLGQRIVVHTDHKNLTFKNLNSERVLRWRLLLEEYGPELRYIKGESNIVADALSRLDIQTDPVLQEPIDPSSTDTMAEAFAVDDDDIPDKFPLTYSQIYDKQQIDTTLQRLREKRPDRYVITNFRHGDKSYDIITRHNKIVVPEALQVKAVQWYHELLMHPGETRTELTLGQHFCWKGMRDTVISVCARCKACQVNKPSNQKLGILPPKTAEVIPWETLCIDLIGPYTIGKGKYSTTLHCLTMIDPATGWFEIAEVPSKKADDIANVLEMTWFSRYPWPVEVVMDRGKEFMAEVKSLLLNEYGITRKPITTRNPQANSMIERAHQTIHNMIRTKQLEDKRSLPEGSWAGILSAVGFAMRATVHTTTQSTPSQLVFNRDAIHNIRFEADWLYIKERKQRTILQNNKRENAKRTPHIYEIGDRVKVKLMPNRKHGEPYYQGPYEVSEVYDNGTVKLRRDTTNGGAVFETWNIRNILPYLA